MNLTQFPFNQQPLLAVAPDDKSMNAKSRKSTKKIAICNSMYLIADSGSTKTAWHLVDVNGQSLAQVTTIGLNPNVLTFERIKTTLETELVPQLPTGITLHKVNFYGASFSVPEYCQAMANLLGDMLDAEMVYVEHDLLGAARAAAFNEQAIVCITGTGSNSCLYDGKTIIEERGGNGYLFGDEGGGADLGRRLIKAALDKTLEPELIAKLEHNEGKSIRQIRNAIYSAERPNAELASFTHFIAAHSTYPTIERLIRASISDFFSLAITLYPDYNKYPLHFIGSIGCIFEPIFREFAYNHGCHIGSFIRQPIDRLTEYHLKFGF